VGSTVKPSKDWRRPVPGDGQERRLMPPASRTLPGPESRRPRRQTGRRAAKASGRAAASRASGQAGEAGEWVVRVNRGRAAVDLDSGGETRQSGVSLDVLYHQVCLISLMHGDDASGSTS
jgi:hypothetical protein